MFEIVIERYIEGYLLSEVQLHYEHRKAMYFINKCKSLSHNKIHTLKRTDNMCLSTYLQKNGHAVRGFAVFKKRKMNCVSTEVFCFTSQERISCKAGKYPPRRNSF